METRDCCHCQDSIYPVNTLILIINQALLLADVTEIFTVRPRSFNSFSEQLQAIHDLIFQIRKNHKSIRLKLTKRSMTLCKFCPDLFNNFIKCILNQNDIKVILSFSLFFCLNIVIMGGGGGLKELLK